MTLASDIMTITSTIFLFITVINILCELSKQSKSEFAVISINFDNYVNQLAEREKNRKYIKIIWCC